MHKMNINVKPENFDTKFNDDIKLTLSKGNLSWCRRKLGVIAEKELVFYPLCNG